MYRELRLFIAGLLLALVCIPVANAADMEQQVAQLEQLSAQWDKLNASTSAYAAALESVKDPVSAAANAGTMEATAKDFITAIDGLVPLLGAARKFRPTPAQAAPFQERLAVIEKHRPEQTEEWTKQTHRYATEIKRIDEMKDLPGSFGEVFNVQAIRVVLAMDGIMRAVGQGMPPVAIRFMTDKLALYEKYGPSKVVDVGLEGGSPADRNSAEKAISKALSNVRIIGLAGDKGQVLTVAPVERLSDITAALKSDMPVLADEGRHRVVVKMGSVEGGSSSGLASVGAGRRSAPPQQSDDDSANGKPITDPGPDWSELETPDDPGRFGPTSGWAYTKLDFLQALGRDKVAFVEVTNPLNDINAKHITRSMLMAASPGAKYARGSGPHYMLGSVEDFGAFCTALTWATIVDRDDARQILKITIDPQKLEKARGVVHVEIVNHEEIRQQKLEEYRARSKAEAEARAAARAANPKARPDFGAGHRGSGSHDWWFNLGILLNHAAKPSGRHAGGSGGKMELVGVMNLEEFCKKLDFLEVTERDEATSTLKIKVDPEKLTNDAVLKRVDVSQLEFHERSQLGLDDESPRGRRRQDFGAASERRTQEQAKQEVETRERREILARIKADVAAGRQPNPADVAALMNEGEPKPGGASPATPPGEQAGTRIPASPPTEPKPPSGQATALAAPVKLPNVMRIWSDRTGKFSVDAKLLRQDADRVVLEKLDGKTIEVPIAKLSDADAKYLREMKVADEDPFFEPKR